MAVASVVVASQTTRRLADRVFVLLQLIRMALLDCGKTLCLDIALFYTGFKNYFAREKLVYPSPLLALCLHCHGAFP